MNIQLDVPLAEKTWFKTGGCAKYFAQPFSCSDFQQAIRFAHQNNLEIFVLGKGANILISDDGFDGLVIAPALEGISIDTDNYQVTARAGLCFQKLITHCLNSNLGGLEEFSGIPGSVGGSVYINIHYYEFLLSQFLVSATLIDKDTAQIFTVDNSWFQFGYDQSKLLAQGAYLLDATFQLKPLSVLETAFAQGRRAEIIRHRARRYPNERTCGSFFRNFETSELHDARIEKPLIYTAYYLDKLGVKGALSVGGAQVSTHHSNMIVTMPGATSSDVIQLACIMQKKVHDTFGIKPQPECQLIGFSTNPLT